jgi:hypothetical protein
MIIALVRGFAMTTDEMDGSRSNRGYGTYSYYLAFSLA